MRRLALLVLLAGCSWTPFGPDEAEPCYPITIWVTFDTTAVEPLTTDSVTVEDCDG